MGINFAAAGYGCYLLGEAKDAVLMSRALPSKTLPARDRDELENEILNGKLKDFVLDKHAFLVRDADEFTAHTAAVFSRENSVITTMMSDGMFKYKYFGFLTPHDGSPVWVVDGQTVFDDLTLDTLIFMPKIIITPEVGDIFSPKVTLESVVIENKALPKEFVRQKHDETNFANNSLPVFVIDCGELFRKNLLSAADLEDGKIVVSYKAKVETQAYKTVKNDEVAAIGALLRHPQYAELMGVAKNSTIKFYDGANPMVGQIAKILKDGKSNPLDIARECYDFARRVIEYDINSKVPPVSVVIAQGNGKCIDYANLMVSLLSECGIPAKTQTGPVGITNMTVGLHGWVEFLVPLKDGSYHWVLCDPTWGDEEKPDVFFQCSDYSNQYGENDLRKVQHFYILKLQVFMSFANYSMTDTQDWKKQ